MAEIDRLTFAVAVASALGEAGLSYTQAVALSPELDKAMLSRAVNGKALSAANYLVLCRALRLDPWNFVVSKGRRLTMKSLVKQAVTAGASRETRERIA